MEQQQLTALQQLLPNLFVVGSRTWPLASGLFKGAPAALAEWLPSTLNSGVRDYTEFIDTRGYGFISVTMVRDAGTVYVTEIYAYDAGLDLSVLPELVSKLPRIQSFTCSNCVQNKNGSDAATRLPAKLASVSPPSLAMLSLGGCQIRGTLPESWSKWQTLEQLWVWDNALSGTIPASWSSMPKLRVFYAEQNNFTGTHGHLLANLCLPPCQFHHSRSGSEILHPALVLSVHAAAAVRTDLLRCCNPGKGSSQLQLPL